MNRPKKHLLDLRVTANESAGPGYALLRLTPADGSALPEMLPGQFVNVEVPKSKHTFLRRPISVNLVDRTANELWLLIKNAGEGTASLCASAPGDVFNILLPLGRGFSLPEKSGESPLLIGGGVGCAPLLYLGQRLRALGCAPRFLIGARSAKDFLQLDSFRALGEVYLTTEDGSEGTRGFVTDHTAMSATALRDSGERLYVCGPLPMMKAVAARAVEAGVRCEVSLENKMACGLGACLCCVENTKSGNECVCTEGPVFPVEHLEW